MVLSDNLEKFLSTYVDTNIAPGAVRFDSAFLLDTLVEGLITAHPEAFAKIGSRILVAMCCGMKRSDLVPHIFQELCRRDGGGSESLVSRFNASRETLVIIWPFVGVPQVIPACLGLAGILQSLGISSIEANRQRPNFADDEALGTATRRKIYAASANSEVFDMLTAFHGDLGSTLNSMAFGYNIGRLDPDIFTLREAEIMVTAALIALGATRQAGSHIKACVSFGYTEEDIIAVVDMAEKLAQWLAPRAADGHKAIRPDVHQLARQAREAMSL